MVSGDDCAPADVPGYGLQCIAQPDHTPGIGNVGYLVLAGYDWYAWHVEAEEWFGMNGDGSLFDQILHREPITGICQGRRLPRTRYDAVLALAKAWAAEQGLPEKSGYRPGERAR